MSVVIRFQSTGIVPGDGRPVPMVGSSLTIGRGNDNDLVLPDPDRVISTHHCAIEDQNGNVVVIDLSTNGTFLNYGKVPLGRVPTPLNDGDILSIGGYELTVDLSSQVRADPLADLPPLAETGSIGPGRARADDDLSSLLEGPGSGKDFLDDLLGESGAPVGPKGIRRPELGEDGVLPPLGEDEAAEADDLLGRGGPDPDSLMGGSQAMHSPSLQDHMPRPRTSSQAIPDDWDLDLSPGPEEETRDNPFDEPAEAADDSLGGAAFIPEDDDLSLGTPSGSTPPPAPPEAASVTHLPDGLTGQGDTPESDDETLAAAVPSEEALSEEAPAADVPAPARDGRASSESADEAAALRRLLQAAGLDGLAVSESDVLPTMDRIGNVLRIMIHGLREILMTRTSIKSEFRIDQTRIAATGNNPLKFSVTPEQAVEVMVKPPSRGYLPAEEAAAQALQDIKAHEVAMMTGMEAALKGVLKKLSPDELESQLTSAGGLGGLLKGKKARYWETYEKIYADVADQAENDFQELFAREFARAYQEQLDRLKGNK